MNVGKEIDALLRLIDDPDEEVYDTVQHKLLQYGSPVIPHLENLWEHSLSNYVQERIEMIIHRINFLDLKRELYAWKNGDSDLLHGACL